MTTNDSAGAAAQGGNGNGGGLGSLQPEGLGEGSPLPGQRLPEPGLPDFKVDYLYRIFCAKDEMPKLEKLLGRLTSGNPYNPPKGFIFPPGHGMRRLQDALGASKDYFVMGYSREEAPDLWADLEARIAAGDARWFVEEDRTIVRESKLCVVLRAEILNPQNNEFVETLVHLADAFRDLLFGVVHDVRMEKVFGHEEWREHVMAEPFSVLNHVVVRILDAGPGETGKRVVTRGLQKFGNPDLAAFSVPAGLELEVQNVLRDFAEHVTQGELIGPDELIDYTVGRIRLVAHPPLEKGGNELACLVDEDESEGAKFDARKGAPKVYAGLKAQREGTEGKRAEGGKGAQ